MPARICNGVFDWKYLKGLRTHTYISGALGLRHRINSRKNNSFEISGLRTGIQIAILSAGRLLLEEAQSLTELISLRELGNFIMPPATRKRKFGDDGVEGKEKGGVTKYYAVRKGFKAGVFTNWKDCQEQTTGFAGAMCKFSLLQKAFQDGSENS